MAMSSGHSLEQTLEIYFGCFCGLVRFLWYTHEIPQTDERIPLPVLRLGWPWPAAMAGSWWAAMAMALSTAGAHGHGRQPRPRAGTGSDVFVTISVVSCASCSKRTRSPKLTNNYPLNRMAMASSHGRQLAGCHGRGPGQHPWPWPAATAVSRDRKAFICWQVLRSRAGQRFPYSNGPKKSNVLMFRTLPP